MLKICCEEISAHQVEAPNDLSAALNCFPAQHPNAYQASAYRRPAQPHRTPRRDNTDTPQQSARKALWAIRKRPKRAWRSVTTETAVVDKPADEDEHAGHHSHAH
jgi:hypothetical protein